MIRRMPFDTVRVYGIPYTVQVFRCMIFQTVYDIPDRCMVFPTPEVDREVPPPPEAGASLTELPAN